MEVLSEHVYPLLHQVISVGGERLGEVSPFKYLCASFTATGQAIGEIKASIQPPSTLALVETGNFGLHNVCINESVVRTILTHGCEFWPLRVEDRCCLEV